MNKRWDPEKRRIYQREYIKREEVLKKRTAISASTERD